MRYTNPRTHSLSITHRETDILRLLRIIEKEWRASTTFMASGLLRNSRMTLWQFFSSTTRVLTRLRVATRTRRSGSIAAAVAAASASSSGGVYSSTSHNYNSQTDLDRGPRSDRPRYHVHARWNPPLPPASATSRRTHASLRQPAADDVTMETYYYGHQSILLGRRAVVSSHADPTPRA